MTARAGGGPSPFLFAKRQLLSRSHSAFIRTVSLLSVLGIAIGVASLLLLQSFAMGFTETIRGNLMSFHPPIMVFAPGGHPVGSDDIDLLASSVEQLGVDVTGIAASLEKTAVASGRQGSIAGVLVRGVDWESESAMTRLGQLTGVTDPGGGVVMGNLLASRLMVAPGDSVRLASTESVEVSGAGRAMLDTILTLRVAGVTDFGLEEFNSGMLLMDLETARLLFRLPPDVEGNSIGVGLRADQDPVAVAGLLGESMRDAYVSSRHDIYLEAEAFITRHANLFRALGLERLAMTIVLALITVVALLNLSSSLTMIALEHQRDSGIMRAMGATPGFIVRLSLSQGALISGIGAVLGAMLALAVAGLANSLFPIRLQASVYWLDSLPARLSPSWFALVIGGTIVAGLVASVFPAIRSVAMTPSEAVRYE